jgi:hypothetical protein
MVSPARADSPRGLIAVEVMLPWRERTFHNVKSGPAKPADRPIGSNKVRRPFLSLTDREELSLRNTSRLRGHAIAGQNVEMKECRSRRDHLLVLRRLAALLASITGATTTLS